MNTCDRLRAGVTTESAEQTRALAAALAAELPADATVALHGNLGVGKTTFVQGLAQGLGVTDPVTSPTFAIYEIHAGRPRRLVHLDAYRIENEQQLESLLLDEFLITPYCLAVEWPEKIAGLIPPDAWHVELSITADDRHRIVLR
ncbi:MAG TPA: tRNA (adenosine(37)-N6)-threonylcarbamoyltransferase complex ATPase subunit type 1 TsaE [Lacunisphaera sp.]|nr:tRNA (adenosine(37)-N6)-threonylcarbamoyltransferase complex ATPase subunit type 1 TsaE [Lacunisphaera sp.]